MALLCGTRTNNFIKILGLIFMKGECRESNYFYCYPGYLSGGNNLTGLPRLEAYQGRI